MTLGCLQLGAWINLLVPIPNAAITGNKGELSVMVKTATGSSAGYANTVVQHLLTLLLPPPSIEPWQRKKPQKGIKSQRGQGEMYGEVKRAQTLSLTRTAVLGLDELARSRGISRSELVEQVGRGIIPLPSV